MKTDWPENKLFLRGLTNFPRFDCIYEKLLVSWFSTLKFTSYSIQVYLLFATIWPNLSVWFVIVTLLWQKNRWLVSVEMEKILLSQIQNCGISIELSRFGFTASLSYCLPRVPFQKFVFLVWYCIIDTPHATKIRPKTSTIILNSHNLGFTLTENSTSPLPWFALIITRFFTLTRMYNSRIIA